MSDLYAELRVALAAVERERQERNLTCEHPTWTCVPVLPTDGKPMVEVVTIRTCNGCGVERKDRVRLPL